jgi:hypothetical protein
MIDRQFEHAPTLGLNGSTGNPYMYRFPEMEVLSGKVVQGRREESRCSANGPVVYDPAK